MKRTALAITCSCFALSLMSVTIQSSAAPLPPPPPPKTLQISTETQVEEAIQNAITEQQEFVLPYLIYETHITELQIAEDESWAIALLNPFDQESQQIVPAEPGLVIVQRNNGEWNAILPGSPDWFDAIQAVPESLLSTSAKDFWLEKGAESIEATLAGPFSGYLLPWTGGETMYLTQSTHHDEYTPSGSAHYSFDFAKPGYPSNMFNVHAAKSGKVKWYVDKWPNGHYNQNNPNEVNYLVIEDTNTSPTTYQLYLHLAQYSIPPELKSAGTPVAQGQLIGIADDTGVSSGNHLHFHVHLSSTLYWDRSVDIQFDDVSINGGRPRIPIDIPYCDWPGDVCNQTQTTYVSGNYDRDEFTPPYGDITAPANGTTQNSSTINLAGWAADDDSGLGYALFKAYFDGAWRSIGASYSTSPFSLNWDMCADRVPDGPVSLALEIRDREGNWAEGQPGLRHFTKNYSCPTPPTACIPGSQQITLFAEPDYQGICEIFGNGSHTTLGALGNDNTASILVGSNVRATLYLQNDLTTRGGSFYQNDPYLNDNRIGENTVSSIKVQNKADMPSTPRLIWPENNASFIAYTSLSLVWEDSGGAQEYQVELNGSSHPWQADPVIHLGALSPGIYLWRVRARNAAGQSSWSSLNQFTIPADITGGSSTFTAPFSDDMESGTNGWTKSSNWDQAYDDDPYHAGEVVWKYDVNDASSGYDNGKANTGDLTSPAISIPDDGNPYFLRFAYLYETESPWKYWDQRWVQISVNGEPFTNLFQLYDDPPNVWLQSAASDLSAYAGETIRVRFHFETFDSIFNNKQGWFIDDFHIDTISPTSCSGADEPNDNPQQAITMTLNSQMSAKLCPSGDIDFFKFNGNTGDQIGIRTQAHNPSTPDTYLYLLDSDGRSVLRENDDQILAVLTDSFLSYRLVKSGTYYIKVRAWAHPSAGDENHDYTISLYKEGNDPSGMIVNPPGDSFLPNGIASIMVSAIDNPGGSGVSHVDFLWHSGDWQYGNWENLGSDWEGGDGWSSPLDTSSLPDQKDIAVYAKVFDWAGNWIGTGSWNLWLDRTPPTSTIKGLATSQKTTAISVEWDGSDNLAGIGYFDVQKKVDGGSWQNWLTGISADTKQAWFIGEIGHTYAFRVRAIDQVGNIGAYSPETSTSVPANTCSGGDLWENDNQSSFASIVSGSFANQNHTFCNPAAGSGWLNDQDWVKIDYQTGKYLTIHAKPQHPSTAAKLRLYASDGLTLLAEATPAEFGTPSILNWTGENNAFLYLQASHLDGRVAGDLVAYELAIQQGIPVFLPQIQKKP